MYFHVFLLNEKMGDVFFVLFLSLRVLLLDITAFPFHFRETGAFLSRSFPGPGGRVPWVLVLVFSRVILASTEYRAKREKRRVPSTSTSIYSRVRVPHEYLLGTRTRPILASMYSRVINSGTRYVHRTRYTVLRRVCIRSSTVTVETTDHCSFGFLTNELNCDE